MENSERTKTKTILSIMHVLAWVVFIGLMVKAGAVLVSYGISMAIPKAGQLLYEKQDLSAIRMSDPLQYSIAALLRVAVAAMEALIALVLIRILSKVNLQKPFTVQNIRYLESISYDLVAIWFVTIMQSVHLEWLGHENPDWVGVNTLFMAGLVFVIAQVFKRGLELQSENEATV